MASLKARVDAPDPAQAYPSGGGKYETAWKAREAALLALLAASPADASRYAAVAFESASAAAKGAFDTSQNKNKSELVSMSEGYGLARAALGMNVAIAANWMRGVWTADQQKEIDEAVTKALDAWPSFSHGNLTGDKASNWVGVCRGAEAVMILASGQEKAREARLTEITGHLLQHMANGYGDLGVSQEGLGYTEYPGSFVLPAALALRGNGDDKLFQAAQKKGWWKLTMYAYTFQPAKPGEPFADRKFLSWGVGERNADEGWASLLLAFVPESDLPYYLWFYDRHMGVLSPRKSFDAHRAGTTWALLLYPSDVTAKDPTGVLAASVADSRGFFFFRNRWADANDILGLAASDDTHHEQAWDQPDAFAIRLMACDNSFLTGPGKEDDRPGWLTTLLVDGKIGDRKKAPKLTGERRFYEARPDGFYLIAGGGSLYKALGLDDAERHTLVSLGRPAENTALIATLDRIKASGAHTYTWNANHGQGKEGGDGIIVTQSTECGRAAFLLKGRNNGYLKGWVVSPADATIETGDPVSVSTQIPEIWVVLYAGSGEPPVAQITGEGLASSITVDGKTLSFNIAANRIENW